jgi:UDP-glucose 4-epimerase
LIVGVSRNGKSNYNFDISNFDNFKQITEIPDIIINCASILPTVSGESFDAEYLKRLFEVNLIGGVNIVKWAELNNIKKIINLSTLSINQKPWSVPLAEDNSSLVTGVHTGYAMSKLCQEKMMTEVDIKKKITILHLRLSAVYGEEMKREGVLFFLQQFLNNNKNIEITNGVKTSFDFIHTKDICSVIAELLLVNIPSGVYNLGSEEEIKLIDLAKLLIKINGTNEQVLNNETKREISRASINCSKIKGYLGEGFSFIPLESGLKNIILS